MNRLTRLCVASMAMMLASAALPSIARAQCTATGSGDSCSEAGIASMAAGRVVRLQMSAGSTALPAPTPTDFDAGFNTTTGPTIRHERRPPFRSDRLSREPLRASTPTGPLNRRRQRNFRPTITSVTATCSIICCALHLMWQAMDIW